MTYISQCRDEAFTVATNVWKCVNLCHCRRRKGQRVDGEGVGMVEGVGRAEYESNILNKAAVMKDWWSTVRSPHLPVCMMYGRHIITSSLEPHQLCANSLRSVWFVNCCEPGGLRVSLCPAGSLSAPGCQSCTLIGSMRCQSQEEPSTFIDWMITTVII